MPAQTGKSSLLAKYGQRLHTAAELHRMDDPPVDGFAQLPAGINNGVARVFKCRFDTVKEGKDNAGEVYFIIQATVVLPVTFNGVKIQGMQFSQIEPLYDTPNKKRKTFEEHITHIQHEMKKLGIKPDDLTGAKLEAAANTLETNKPFFKYRTWAGDKQEVEEKGGRYFVGKKGPYATEEAAKKANPYVGKEPMTNVNWMGATTLDTPSGNGEAAKTATATAGVDESNESSKNDGNGGGQPKATTTGVRQVPNTTTTGNGVGATPVPFNEFSDLDSLAERAEADDDEAQKTLLSMADKAGVLEKAQGMDLWADVVKLITSINPATKLVSPTVAAVTTLAEAEEEESIEEEGTGLNVGDIVDYRPLVKKDGKNVRSDNSVKCEITALSGDGTITTLKRLDNNAIVKGVKIEVLG